MVHVRLPRSWRIAAVGSTVAVLCLGPLPMAAADGPGYGGDAGALAVSWVASTDSAPITTPVDQPTTAPSDSPTDSPASAPTDAPISNPSEPAATTDAPVPSATTDAPVPSAMSFGGGARGVAAAFALPATDPALTPDALSLMVRGLGFRSKSKIQVRIGSDLPVETRADSAGALAVALDPRKLGGAQPGVSVMAVGRNQSGTEVTLFGSVPPVADGSGPMSLVPWGVACVALVGLAAWMRRRHTSHASATDSDAVV